LSLIEEIFTEIFDNANAYKFCAEYIGDFDAQKLRIIEYSIDGDVVKLNIEYNKELYDMVLKIDKFRKLTLEDFRCKNF